MITINVYKDGVKNELGQDVPSFHLETFNKINIIAGSSGSGKSHFFSVLNMAILGAYPWRFTCNNSEGEKVKLIQINNITDLSLILNGYTNSVIVIDENITQLIKKNNDLGKLEKSKNYFILLDRDIRTRIQINVSAVLFAEEHSLKEEKIIVFKPIVKLNSQPINEDIKSKITHFITEDTASGRIFWENIFDAEIKIYKPDVPGNSGIKNAIIELLVHKKISGDILIALDYDRGSKEMLDILDCTEIDKSRIHFIALESFEEIICNSEFILDKYPELRDLVINYRKYIDATYRSTGAYFSSLLFTFVKQKPPIEIKGKRNVEQFYRKGIEYFKQCFIDDCCGFNSESCKLQYDGDKKKAMLANKFEGYRIFI